MSWAWPLAVILMNYTLHFVLCLFVIYDIAFSLSFADFSCASFQPGSYVGDENECFSVSIHTIIIFVYTNVFSYIKRNWINVDRMHMH